MTDVPLQAGTQVRLRNDPGRSGVLTGRNRPLSGTLHYQVAFPEGNSYQPEYELEVIDSDTSDIFEMLQNGRYGRVADLRRNLLHIQLSGRLANLVYSMETTNTDFYAYQFKPVLSFLDSPSNGLLIADEVGLGKTIEAGLIWTELRARYDARRLLVVCPAMLREKWRDELRERFGVDATFADAAELVEHLKRDKHEVNDGKAIICSFQGLRPPKQWEDEVDSKSSRNVLPRLLVELSSSEPAIDLIIIDEAHYLRNPESQTSKLGTMLRNITEHIVLLSATPVNLKEDDLFHLLKLVDPDTFREKEFFPQVLKANEPLHKARELVLDRRSQSADIKKLLAEAISHEPLRNSLQLKNLIDEELTSTLLADNAERVRLANRIEKVNLLRHAVSRTRKVEVTEWKVEREPITELVNLNPVETNFYNDVTQAVRIYASSSNVSAGFLLVSPQRQVSSCMYAALQAWSERQVIDAEQLYEDFGVEDLDSKKISPLIDHLIETVLPNYDLDYLKQNDSKYERFENIIAKYLEDHDTEKVVVFSYFRKTLDYLSERLGQIGVKNQVLVGGMRRTKQEIIDEFREDESIKVLLSSEVASEGVDLQFCRLLVNYDLPWNPMKIEQRIGRLDRIGQKADKINIWNLCYADTIDERILERLFDRLDIFRRALGGMEAILGEEIETLTNDILCAGLTEEQINKRIEKTAFAIEQIKQDQQNLENEASHLIAHQGYILEQVQAAHEFSKRISDMDLILYVGDYLEKYGQGHVFHQTDKSTLDFDIKLPPKTASSLHEFIQRNHLHGQTTLATGEETDCQFVNKVPFGNRRKEFISQFHPFIRFISADLKTKDESFYPLIAAKIDIDSGIAVPRGIYAFVIYRWSFQGLRVEEELKSHVFALDTETSIGFDKAWEAISLVRAKGQDWLAAPNLIDVEQFTFALDQCSTLIITNFEKEKREKEIENEDRVSFQVQSAQRHRDRQLETHNRVLQGLREKGHDRLIPARQGLIRKVKERFDFQEETLRRKAILKSHYFEVCFGTFLAE